MSISIIKKFACFIPTVFKNKTITVLLRLNTDAAGSSEFRKLSNQDRMTKIKSFQVPKVSPLKRSSQTKTRSKWMFHDLHKRKVVSTLASERWWNEPALISALRQGLRRDMIVTRCAHQSGHFPRQQKNYSGSLFCVRSIQMTLRAHSNCPH